MIETVCTNIRKHTSCPVGYIAWHEWAEKKGRRHKQIMCPKCDLYVIWIRREKREPDYGKLGQTVIETIIQCRSIYLFKRSRGTSASDARLQEVLGARIAVSMPLI